VRIGILEPSDFSPRAIELLSELGDVEQYSGSESPASFVSGKDALFIRLAYQIDRSFLEYASSLRYLCTPTTGLNHVDMQACRDNGVRVLCLKGEQDFLASIRATPEHTFGLVLALLRNYATAFRIGSVESCDRDLYKGEEVYKNRVGIIGFGRVGKRLAQYFSVFGASSICFYDTDANIEGVHDAYRVDSVGAVIEQSDIVLLCASYSADSEMMIGRGQIDKMKGRYFVNTARGELVDEEYLLEKVQSGHFKGVALDVITNETDKRRFFPFLEVSPSHNFLITPHISGATYTSMHRTEEFIASRLLEEIGKEK